jgi:hypothetical protein
MRPSTEIDGVRVYVPKAYFTTYGVRQNRAVEETVRAVLKRAGDKVRVADVTINRVTLRPDRTSKWAVSYSWSSEAR